MPIDVPLPAPLWAQARYPGTEVSSCVGTYGQADGGHGAAAFPEHSLRSQVRRLAGSGTHSTRLFSYPFTQALSYQQSYVHKLREGCDPAAISISAGRLK